MTYQDGCNILVALKAETTTGVAVATVTGAQQLRLNDSPGLNLNRAVVQSEEKRSDGMKTIGRLGFKTVDGSFSCELSPGGATDVLLEAVMRGTWATATAITFGSMTSITTGTNEVIAVAGDWVGTQGIRVGDVFRLSNHSTAANNNKNLMVTAATSLTLSVATNLLTADASADATGTLTVLRKLINPATPTRRSFNIEQHDKLIGLSEVYLGCRCVGLNLSCQPGAMVQVQYTFQGLDRNAMVTGTSPFFTSPTLTTSLGMIADDSSIRFNGALVTDFTGFDLNFQITANGVPVIGSLTSPDMFDCDLAVSGTITGLRKDFSNITLYDAETEFEVSVLLQESESEPKSCLGIFIPRSKFQSLTAPVGGSDGAKIETKELMIGPKVAATGYDATVAVFSSSEAP